MAALILLTGLRARRGARGARFDWTILLADLVYVPCPGLLDCRPVGAVYGKPAEGRKLQSVPNVAFVVRELIAAEELAELFLEALCAVMLLLALNVSAHGRNLRLRYRERAISGLPPKVWGPLPLHSLRGPFLGLLYDVSNGSRAG